MKQQKKFTKSNVGGAALGDPHHVETALNKCRGDFNRPYFGGLAKNNGITLISLVITVVVLLILAGVAISIVVSPDGLFTKSEQAKTDWNAKVDEEQIKINEALGYLGIKPPVQLPAGWESSKVADVVTETSTIAGVEKERKAPIPVGYTKSGITTEDEISEGLVIYQTDTAVTGEPNSEEHIAAMEGINQYVWIPVDDINDMVMCKKNGNNGTCELDYNVTTPNEITCQTHGYTTSTELTDDNIDTTGLAGRLYGMEASTTDTAAPKIYTTNMEFTEASKDAHRFKANSTDADSKYREPDLVTNYDNSNYQLVLNESTQALESANELKRQLNKKFIEMAKSVAKYGGFYISRYEASYESNKVISKKNKAVFNAAWSSWYDLYSKTLNNVEKDASVNSHMIWGCQYDQVIEFLGDKAEVGHLYQTTKKEKTGYSREENGNLVIDQDILNNIYDLEGNRFEWTAQAVADGERAGRGGYARNASIRDLSTGIEMQRTLAD